MARDELELSRTASSSASEALSTLQSRHRDLEKSNAELQSTHSTLESAHTALRSTHEALVEAHDSVLSSSSEASSSRSTLQADLTTARAELDKTRSSLSSEKRRADAAEKKRAALQSENGELVAQLEEVRGKVVAVTEEKADLASRLETLGRRPTDPVPNGIPSPLTPDEALELSRRAEQIRTLESALHASTSRVHALSRQLTDLHAAYTTAQRERDDAITAVQSGLSPGGKRGILLSPDERPRTAVDAILPAAVRHRRQVSLAGLKARMEPRRGVKMESLAEEEDVLPGKQFGDEIMFCCPACDGDLITL